jgi:hypothetical protein
MVAQMLEVGQNCVPPLRDHQLHDLSLVVGLCFALNDLNGAFGTMPDAGAKPVTKKIADESGLAINNLQGAFMAIGDT